MGRPVIHFEIMGRDSARLRAFYTDLFAWKLNADNPFGYATVERDDNLSAEGVGIGGGIGQTSDFPGYVTFYVEVPDVEASLTEAVGLGGTRLMGPEQIMDGVEIGMFTDPEGNVIGLLQQQS